MNIYIYTYVCIYNMYVCVYIYIGSRYIAHVYITIDSK